MRRAVRHLCVLMPSLPLVSLLGSVRGYGFWYRFLTHPEGPSFTRDVCPKFSPMGDFKDNVAHSNMFYGLRCGGGVFVWHASALPEVPYLPASLSAVLPGCLLPFHFALISPPPQSYAVPFLTHTDICSKQEWLCTNKEWMARILSILPHVGVLKRRGKL